MENKDSLEVAMTLIMYGGEAKSCAIEAIAAAKKQDFDRAQERLSQAQKALLQAHHAQAEMLTKGATEIVDLHTKFDEYEKCR